MIEISNKKNYINLFDDITDLSSYLKRPRKPGRCDESEDEGDGFSGTNTFEEAFDLLKYGDEELLKQVKKEQEKVNIEKLIGNAKKRQTYFNNRTGIVPNVPNYLLNIPNNMIDIHKNKISHKIINIYLDISVSGGNDKKEIIRIGTKYLSVIEILESLGYRCNLYAGVSSNDNWDDDNQSQHLYVRIKTDREPLNIKKICFPIAHPSFLRRIYFRWAEVNDSVKDITHHGYGGVKNAQEVKEMLKNEMKDDFIVLGYGDGTRTLSVKDIINNLKKEGININVEED
jgi:hypothetical protein